MDSLFLHAIRAALFGFVWFFAVIFIPAWTLNYWQGWAFFLTLGLFTSLATIYIALHDKRLLERRINMGPTAEKTSTQKIITAIGAPLFIGAIVIMVFDHRFGWSPAVPACVSVLGDALAALGILIYYFVVRENRYAAAAVVVEKRPNGRIDRPLRDRPAPHVYGRHHGFYRDAPCARVMVGTALRTDFHRRIRVAAFARGSVSQPTFGRVFGVSAERSLSSRALCLVTADEQSASNTGRLSKGNRVGPDCE